MVLVPPIALRLYAALQSLDAWRDNVRQSFIEALDADLYNVPDAMVLLNEAHEKARGVIAMALLEYTDLLPPPEEDDGVQTPTT